MNAWAWCTIGMLLVAQGALAQQTSPRLSDDARLQRAISHDYGAISFKDLCAELSKTTGATISAGARTMNDMLVLVVKDKPCWEVMAKTASHFGFAWETRGEAPRYSYHLVQSDASLAKEAKLRKQQEIAGLVALRKAAAEEAKVTATELDSMRAKLRKWYEAEPQIDWEKAEAHSSDQEYHETPEEAAQRQWNESRPISVDGLNPCRRATARFVAGLDDAALQRLADGASVTYCTTPRQYQLRLSFNWLPDVRSWLAWTPPEEEAPATPPGGQTKEQDAAAERKAEIDARIGSETMPQLNRTAMPGLDPTFLPGRLAIVSLSLEYAGNGRRMGSEGLAVMLTAMDGQRRILASSEVHFDAAPEDSDKPKREPAPDYSKDPVLGTTVVLPKSLSAGATPTPDDIASIKQFLLDADRLDPLERSQGQRLQAIAAASGHSVIADAYDRQIGPFMEMMRGRASATRLRVGQQLDGLDDEFDQSWKLADGWIAVRSRRAAYLRPRQLPRPVVRTLLRLMLGKSEASFDELAEIAASGTDIQFENALGLGSMMPTMGTGVMALGSRLSRAALRLWGKLPAEARRRLLAGEVVSARMLSQSQQDEYVATVRDYQSNGFPSNFDMFEDVPAGPVDVATVPGQSEPPNPLGAQPPSPYDWSEYVPEATPVPLALAIAAKNNDAFYLELGTKDGASLFHMPVSGRSLATMIQISEADLGQMASAGLSPRAGRERAEGLTFRFFLTDRTAIELAVRTSHRVPNSEFDPMKPPDDVKKMLEKYKPHEPTTPDDTPDMPDEVPDTP